jgi:hypothetical protein
MTEEQVLPIGPDMVGRPRHLLVTKVICGA